MERFIRIGVDLGKNYFQLHALESEDGQAKTRKLSRRAMPKFFSGIEPCLIGMEACASSHYWARELMALGHDVRLIPPIYVKPYVKRGKNDAADAAAICEALSRPGMRFVPVKSAENQAALMLHKTRELLIKQRTMSINALRGHLAEFGRIAAKGIGRIGELAEAAEKDVALPSAARKAAKVLARQIEEIDRELTALEAEIAAIHAASATSRLLAEVPGIGKLTATAIAAHMPCPHAFQRGRDFSAWLGLTPRQNSSGGKPVLGAITKAGNRYLRRLLVLAATSLLHGLGKRKGALRDWIAGLLARKPARLVTVALANKLARIVFAMLKTGESFRAQMFAKA